MFDWTKSPRLYPPSKLGVVSGLWRYISSTERVSRLRRLPASRELNPKPWMINKFLEIIPGKRRYIEIGLRKGRTFERVKARNKIGIDPDPQFNLDWLPKGVRIFRGTSDEFFSEFPAKPTYDLIFIDGLHTFDQVARDILNCLEWVKCNGVIIVDDCWPRNSRGADPRGKIASLSSNGSDDTDSGWWGDVWKTLPWLLSELRGHEVYLVGERGSAFCVLLGNISNETKVKLRREIPKFEESNPSEVFRGDFEECRIPTTDLSSVLAHYRETLGR
jgi:hypothetical protein